MFKKIGFILALLMLPVIGGHGQSDRETQGQQFPNLLDRFNPGFENAGSKWIASPTSTFSITSSGVGRGQASAIFDAANASEFLRSALVPIPEDHIGKDCLGRVSLKDGGVNLKLQVYDGTDVKNEVTLPAATGVYTEFQIPFTCEAGNISLRLFAAGDESPLRVDSAYIGKNDRVGTAEKPDWLVDVNIGGGEASLGTGNTATFSQLFNASFDMVVNPANTLDVKIPCDGANPPTSSTTCGAGSESIGISFVLPEAGTVEACFSFEHSAQLGGTNNVATQVFQLVETPINAVTITQEGGRRAAVTYTNQHGSGVNRSKYFNLCGNFVFASAGQKVIRLFFEQQIDAGSMSSSNIRADRSAPKGQRDIHITVKPVSAPKRQTVIIPELDSWVIEADLGGTSPAGNVTSSNYTRIDDTGLNLVIHKGAELNPKVPCDGANPPTGLTCAAGAEMLGISFDLPKAGRVEVCVGWVHRIRVSNGVGGHEIYHKLATTTLTNNAIVIDGVNVEGFGTNPQGSIGFVVDDRYNASLCQEFDFPTAEAVQILLFQEVLQSGAAFESNQFMLARESNSGDRSFHIRVKPVTQNVPVPVLVDFPDQQKGAVNVGLFQATTTNANDSYKVSSSSGAPLSPSNKAIFYINSLNTPGQLSRLVLTQDVVIDLTGAHFSRQDPLDFSDMKLVAYAINDGGTAPKIGIATVSQFNVIVLADSTATPGSITTGSQILVNSTLSGSSPAIMLGYILSDFDDTGGAAENLWVVKSGLGNVLLGHQDIPIVAHYTRNSSQAIGNSATTVIDYSTKVRDSHNQTIFSGTFNFKAPIDGYYDVNCRGSFSSGTWSAGQIWDFTLRVNTSNILAWRGSAVTTGGHSPNGMPTGTILADKNAIIDCTVFQNSGGSRNIDGVNTRNWFTVHYVGPRF